MPNVPVLGPVQQSGLPSARFSTETNPEAFGAGAVKAGQAAIGVGETALKMAADSKRRADDAVTKQFEQDLNQEFNKLLHDPKTGALFTRGQNAFDIENSYGEQYDKFVTDKIDKLSNGDQKAMAKLISQNYRTRLTSQLNQHTGKEIQTYETSLTENGIKLAREDAILNYQEPGLVDSKIQIQEGYLRDHAMNQGMSPEQTAVLVSAARGQTYQGVISKMIDDRKYKEAQEMFDKVSPDIDSNSRERIQKDIKTGALLGESQQQADNIWVKANGNYSDALRAAEGIQDPDLRRETLQQVRQKQSDANAALQDSQNDAWLSATEYVKAAPGQDPKRSIPTTLWNRLTLEQQNSLSKFKDNPVNDSKAWLDFLDLPPTTISSMSRAEFESRYWSKFDESHRGRAETMWLAAKDAKGNSMQLTNTITYKDMLESTAITAGLLPAKKPSSGYNKDQAERFARLEQAAAIAIEDFEITELGGKRKATNQEKQNVIDNLFVKKIQTERGFFFNSTSERYAFELAPGEELQVDDISNIPKFEIEKIKDYMSRNKIIYSEDKAIQLYNQKLKRVPRG